MSTNGPNGDLRDTNEELLIARLMKQAGARVEPPTDRRAWVYDRVLADWEEQTQSNAGVSKSGIWWAVAATVLVGLSLLLWQTTFVEVPGIDVATAARVDGPVEYSVDGDHWLPLSVGAGVTKDATIRTGKNARIALTSDTGASIRLDNDTRLRVGINEVLELYAGAVYVDSNEEAASNIVVQTPFGHLKEVGTQFEVRLSPDAGTLKVRDGSVAFGVDQLAAKGDVVRLSDDENRRIGNVTSNAADWQWTQAIAPAFSSSNDSQTLLALVEWVARESGLTIQWSAEARVRASKASLNAPISGHTPLDVLRIYAQTTTLEYSIKGDALVITVVE